MKKIFLSLLCTLLTTSAVMAASINPQTFLTQDNDGKVALLKAATEAEIISLYQTLANVASPIQKAEAAVALLNVLNANYQVAPAATETFVVTINSSSIDFINIVKDEKSLDLTYLNSLQGKLKGENDKDKDEESVGKENTENKDAEEAEQAEEDGAAVLPTFPPEFSDPDNSSATAGAAAKEKAKASEDAFAR